MNNEKMMILKMLEEGKINADEASRLLNEANSSSYKGTNPGAGARPSAPTGGGYSSEPRSNNNSGYAPRPSASSSGESFAEEMSRKFGTFMKDMEPKIQKFTEVVVEKTTTAADSISKSLSTPAAPPMPTRTERPQPSSYAPPRSSAPNKGIEQVIELKVANNSGELNLTGLNGQVLVKGYNGDKISAKIYTVAKRAGAKIELMVLGSKYYLNYDENDFERVCVDAFVPEAMFENIRIATVNGGINVSTIITTNLKVDNLNGDTELSSVKAENVMVESNNGNLVLSQINAKQATFENFNGAIAISNIDIARLKVTTFNGGVNMQIAEFRNYAEYEWKVETSNEKLNMILPSSSALGYYVKAHAALNNVKLGLIGLNYIQNDKSFAEAKSFSYDTASKKVNLYLETSNAPLVLN